MTTEITRERIAATEAVIRPYVRRTPVLNVDLADFGLASSPVTFKLEMLQHSGAFKVRGAFANLLLRKVPAAGIAAASGGNHGAAVAYAAQRLGVSATIFLPDITSPAKAERIRDYGARLEIVGTHIADALIACDRFVAETGAMSVHPFDQAETMLGQGSVGMELEQDASLDTLLVAVGGGGLIGSLAAWFGGKVRIIGVEPELAPDFAFSACRRKAGRCARRRDRRRCTGAAAGGTADVSDRACACRRGAAGQRGRHQAGAGGAVANLARGRRARRRDRVRGAAVAALSSGARRARRPDHQRRQYHGGEFRELRL